MKKLMKDSKLWKNNKQCPVCGFPTDPQFFACETGYDYCSEECVREHVRAWKEGAVSEVFVEKKKVKK